MTARFSVRSTTVPYEPREICLGGKVVARVLKIRDRDEWYWSTCLWNRIVLPHSTHTTPVASIEEAEAAALTYLREKTRTMSFVNGSFAVDARAALEAYLEERARMLRCKEAATLAQAATTAREIYERQAEHTDRARGRLDALLGEVDTTSPAYEEGVLSVEVEG